MFKFDDKEIDKLERDLEKFASRALPIATGRTLGETAALTRRFAIQDVGKKFNTRNAFTRGSILFDKTDTRNPNINRQRASAGSVQDYMRAQEFGEDLKSTGKHGVPVPTGTASNEGDRPKPKKKLPTRANRRTNIRFGTASKGKLSRRQRNVALVKEAAENKDKYIFMHTSKRKGIYKVMGGKRKPRIKMLWDLTKRTRPLKPNPWLMPAAEDALELQPSLYRKHLRDQIRRANLFN